MKRLQHTAQHFEIDALLRLLLADHGTIEDLSRAVDEMEADVGEHDGAIGELMVSYLDGKNPFPGRTHLSVLFATSEIERSQSIE